MKYVQPSNLQAIFKVVDMKQLNLKEDNIFTSQNDSIGAVLVKETLDDFSVKVFNVDSEEIIFKSNNINSPSFNISNILYLSNEEIIFCINSSKDIYLRDYYSLNININKLSFLFTKPKGLISPDKKYLAYETKQAEEEFIEYSEMGYYIYNFENKKTTFYPTKLYDSHQVPNKYTKINDMICWVNKANLIKLHFKQ